jgi:hypothetical protein
MKKVLTIALAVFLVACNKDQIPKNTTDMTASMEDHVFSNDAVVRKDSLVSEGDWTYEGNFTDSIASTMTVRYYEESGAKEVSGSLTFDCHLEPPTFKDGKYTGVGIWTISDASGTLAGKFNNANGDLTYSELEPSADNPDDPVVRDIEFTGVVDK